MRLFFSWQSDIPTNKNIIRKSLQKICEELDIEYTEDTRGEAGGDHVVDVLLRKISNSDIFVGDITIVGKAVNGDPLSNSNVTYELGYAESKLGRSRIIMCMNEEHGTYEDMVFDLGKRMITRLRTADDKIDATSQKELTAELKAKINSIINTGQTQLTQDVDKFEKTILYWAHNYGGGFIEQSPHYIGSASQLTVGESIFDREYSAIFYGEYDTKEATFYLKAIDKLVTKNYLTPVVSSTARTMGIDIGKSWLVTQEGEIVAAAVSEAEVFKMLELKKDKSEQE